MNQPDRFPFEGGGFFYGLGEVTKTRPCVIPESAAPSNMQWQTKADAKAKDKWE